MLDLSLPGMTCGGCARGVTAAIRELDPQAEVETDVENRRARIRSTAPESAIRAAMIDNGYMEG
ncbi:MAG: heavy-metal-associated domain-containing protein [Qingshengfaniella sp.]